MVLYFLYHHLSKKIGCLSLFHFAGVYPEFSASHTDVESDDNNRDLNISTVVLSLATQNSCPS